MIKHLTIGILLAYFSPLYASQEIDQEQQAGMASGLSLPVVPDLREEDIKVKIQGKKTHNMVIVPVPMSSPTFGSGLILGGAYFYPQTDQQKQKQPASFTGAAAAYTDNKSWFAGVMQQNYWAEDKWRFTGVAGLVDFKLTLVEPTTEGSEKGELDWLVTGGLAEASIARRLGGRWFLGLSARYLDIEQDLDLSADDSGFNLGSTVTSPGIGLSLNYDARDLPMNAYEGRLFEIKTVFADQTQRDAGSYQSYFARFRSYHPLKKNLVLAFDVKGCKKSGQIPLWDTCRLNLRGFPITDYLSKESISIQAEARWRFYKRWGLVAFAGGGRVDDSLGSHGEDKTIPSYGVGLRFMVLESQRINIRVDYARTDNDSDAWYLGVTEAF